MSQSEQLTLSTPNLSITNFGLPSLHLLRDEIVVILKDAETHLSDFNDDQEQAPLLLDSIGVLTQLARIFELISLTGAKLLSTAIADGMQRLYDHGDNTDSALIMDLSEAIMTLDRYVEFVLLTETVEPTLLLSIINKLHKTADQQPIAADYFATFGSSSVIIANPEQNFQPLSELNLDTDLLSRAYRSGLSVALTQTSTVLTEEQRQKLAAMSAACALIAANSKTLFWQAATAAVMGLESILPLSLTQKHTLIYLEQQFHHYLPVMDTRFADLVNFACQRDNALAHDIRSQYATNQLDDPQRDQLKSFLFGPNRQVTDALNDLIQAQISNIKEQVDEYARGDSINAATMQSSQISDQMVTLSSALRLLKLNNAAASLDTAATAVASWEQTPTPSDFDHLLLALMSAENATISMAKMHTPGAINLPLNNKNISLHQLDTAYDTLIEESRTAIAGVEQALNDYLADSSRDVVNIQNIPEMMRQVSGAVRFLQLPTSASMLSQLAGYIDQRFASQQTLDDHVLSHIADVIMSVDYRLDSFEHNRPVSKQSLDIAQHSLSQLLAA